MKNTESSYWGIWGEDYQCYDDQLKDGFKMLRNDEIVTWQDWIEPTDFDWNKIAAQPVKSFKHVMEPLKDCITNTLVFRNGRIELKDPNDIIRRREVDSYGMALNSTE